jgi:hypothetical protein
MRERPYMPPLYDSAQMNLTTAKLTRRAMTTTSRWLAVALLLLAVALAAPAGAQFAGGHSAFDQRSGPEPAQFHDFFGGRSSYPNNSYDPFGGDRRSSYPNNSYDPYNPSYRRPQVYESIKPPAPRKVETPSTATVVVIGDTFGETVPDRYPLVGRMLSDTLRTIRRNPP